MRLVTVRAECPVIGLWHGQVADLELTERVFNLIRSGHLTWLIADEDLGELVEDE